MQTCISCTHKNGDDARYCSKCGAPLDPREYLRKEGGDVPTSKPSDPLKPAAKPKTKPQPRERKRENTYDRRVGDFFTSKTLRYWLAFWAVIFCCACSVGVWIMGGFASLISSLGK